jgi:cyclopropane-fatty-acyl-phospholipid synthase
MGRAESIDTAVRAPKGSERRSALAREARALLRRALPADRPLELVLADDAASGPGAGPERIVVNGPNALGRVLWPPSADALGEAYLRGDIDIEGDIWTVVDAGRAFDLRRLGRRLPRLARLGLELRRGAAPAPRLKRVARLSGRRHSRARDLAAVRFHYDVGNDFYALWLDRRLAYSCAYFATPKQSLDAAQEAKLDLICRKLRLEPGMRLLDIGCGWGSLVIHAAERYGVQATGITLSARQARWATDEIRRRGLQDRARGEVRDYRDLAELGPFDAVASVGMFEHVGRERKTPSAGCRSARRTRPPRRSTRVAPSTSAARPATTRSWPTRIATVTRPRSTAARRTADPQARELRG